MTRNYVDGANYIDIVNIIAQKGTYTYLYYDSCYNAHLQIISKIN